MIKTHTQWSFTDQPDMFRICRELRDAGCWLGTAARADGTVTLVDVDKIPTRKKADTLAEIQKTADDFHVFGAWYCLKGDFVQAILGVTPVTVKGYR